MKKTISVQVQGGLGNQLFQVAFGLTQVARTGSELALMTRKEDDISFSKLGQVIDVHDVKKTSTPQGIRGRISRRVHRHLLNSYVHENFLIQPSRLEARASGLFFGYWQSTQYFDWNLIRHKLRLNKVPVGKTRFGIENKGAVVAMHIRRGDYLLKENQAYHGLLPDAYFGKAMDIMKRIVPGCYFYVFTDDPGWAEEKYRDVKNLKVLKGNTDVQDLRLMSECEHCITANSSFSWWGAFLNSSPDKKIIMPMPWYKVAKTITTDVYIPGAIILKE